MPQRGFVGEDRGETVKKSARLGRRGERVFVKEARPPCGGGAKKDANTGRGTCNGRDDDLVKIRRTGCLNEMTPGI